MISDQKSGDCEYAEVIDMNICGKRDIMIKKYCLRLHEQNTN